MIFVKDIYSQIEPFKTRRAGKLSGRYETEAGTELRVDLLCPSVLLLDEPTTGVDVVSRKEFWKYAERVKTTGNNHISVDTLHG